MARPRGRPKRSAAAADVEYSIDDKLERVRAEFVVGVQWGKVIDLDDWADRHRVLPQESSSEYGVWSTARFPFLRRIMKALSPSSLAREIVVMKGAQLGFTETAINWMLYTADCHPGPMLYAQKTEDAVKDFVKQKLVPSIEACARVHGSLGAGKPKACSSSWDNKGFPGGSIVLGGANSSPFLRSKSTRDGIFDEEDTFDADIDEEGSPSQLLAKRMQNFPDRKFFRLSTPKLEETSVIEPAFEAGSQERYYVPCPHCNEGADPKGFMFWLQWDQIKWGQEADRATGVPVRVWLECPNCAGEIDEGQSKTWMLDHGDWYSEKGEDGEPVPRYRVGDVENPSFHISSLYSPVPFFSWRDAVADWFKYLRTRDVAILKVHINQNLAETFSTEGHELSYSHLESRREDYSGNLLDFDVPAGAMVLTAGADVQDDRIEVEVVGWGELEENWSIDYAVFPGDTALMGDRYGMLPDGRPSVWRLLDDYLLKRWNHASGVEMMVESSMIDCGHKTEEVHTFCRSRESRNVFPLGGKEGWGKGFWSASRKRHERFGTFRYTAYVDELKAKMYSQLQIDSPGPGFCHFPKKPVYGEKYFKGLTCERRKVKFVRGRKKLFWETPSGARNEPTDCRNYAQVAILAYPVDIAGRAREGLGSLFKPRGTSSGRMGTRKKRRRGSPGIG